jgi:hypothetical protein
MRHLKNINELILYASISCGASFVGRLLPALYFPILLLRLGIFLYCAYVIAKLEGNRETAYIIGGSLFIGMIGGYWDLIEVYLRFNLEAIAALTTMTIAFLIAVGGLILQVRALTSGKTSKK